MKSYINKDKLLACIGLLLPLFLFFGTNVFGQVPSSTQNYVMETTVKSYNKKTTASLAGLLVDSANRTIQYFDGLGRSLQSVQWQGSPSKKDVVQLFAYDKFGRETFKYLPYAEQNSFNGSIKNSPLSNQASFYSANSWDANVAKTPFPYSETIFEASPLNSVLEQGAPGQNWQIGSGHTQKINYEANIANNVRFYHAEPDISDANNRNLVDLGYYTANQLYVVITKDENWTGLDGKAGTIEEFKDKDGRIVLKRTFNKTTGGAIEPLSTYYIYDDLGNLSFVLTPGTNADITLPNQTLLDDFSYQYRYDSKQRMIEKKIPGKGWEYTVYNKLDQVVLTQDSKQKEGGKWLYTKYDAFGRIVITGIHANSSVRSVMQSTVTADAVGHNLWESRISGDYGNVAYPRVDIETLTINYYDDYTFPGAGTYPFSIASTMVKGLQTGSKVNVLGTSDMLLNVLYYNNKAQLVKSFNQHYLAGSALNGNYDDVSNTYNFAGEVVSSIRVHHTASANTTIASRYVYDHAGRKQKVYQQMNNDAEVLLVTHSYNEIGQVKEKQLHNGLQTTKYTYNERGWLKQAISPQFQMKLGYDTLSNYAQYNGNIAIQEWGNGFANKFTYAYDRLNRLTSGIHVNPVSSLSMSEELSYDLMGNVSTLNRDGAGISTYSYTGNRLNGISGNSVSTMNYAYDVNGNATIDGRNAVTLTYNVLGLPQTVLKLNLNMTYTYDALGKKLQKLSNLAVTSDYVDGIHYTGGSIDFVLTEEGRARKSGNIFSYEYDLKDHLGNIRFSFDINGGTLRKVQQQDYYAFGKIKESTQYLFGEKNKYLYNSKELQEELGQYDYGARFYDPVIGRWNVIDNKSELYFQITPYAYAANTPINAIDPDGNLVIFIAGQNTGDGGTSGYWRSSGSYKDIKLFNQDFTNYFRDNHELYLDGASGGWLNTISAPGNPFLSSNLDVDNRISAGRAVGKSGAKDIINSLKRTNGVITESIKVVAHSMGAAYAKGLIMEIVEYAKAHPEECQGLSITEYDFAAFQQNKLSAVPGVPLYQFDNEGDSVVDGIFGRLTGSHHATQKSAKEHKKDVNPKGGHSIFDFISVISNLEEGNYKFIDGKFIKQN